MCVHVCVCVWVYVCVCMCGCDCVGVCMFICVFESFLVINNIRSEFRA